jgi:hypothetical protein
MATESRLKKGALPKPGYVKLPSGGGFALEAALAVILIEWQAEQIRTLSAPISTENTLLYCCLKYEDVADDLGRIPSSAERLHYGSSF